jgi:outer membrane protein assembly factor BamE
MRRALLVPLLSPLLLGGCAMSLKSTDDFLGLITPYRIDIVQGNVVTKEQMALLKPGMSRNQVRDVLGSPLLTDPFHTSRWDYIFTIRRPGTEPQRRSVVVIFDGENMKSVESPELPSEREFVAAITSTRGGELKTPKLELSADERKALPVPPKPDAPAPEPSGPVREYPPLEAAT